SARATRARITALNISASTRRTSKPTSRGSKASAPGCSKARSRFQTGPGSRFCGRRTTGRADRSSEIGVGRLPQLLRRAEAATSGGLRSRGVSVEVRLSQREADSPVEAVRRFARRPGGQLDALRALFVREPNGLSRERLTHTAAPR